MQITMALPLWEVINCILILVKSLWHVLQYHASMHQVCTEAEHESNTTSTCTHLIHGRKTMIGRIFYGHAQFMYSTRASVFSALHSRTPQG